MQIRRIRTTNPYLTRLACCVALAAMAAGAAIGPARAHDLLPVGDGKISNGPRPGHLFSCQQRFNPNAPGSHRLGDWVKNGNWDRTAKPFVDGNVRWPDARIDIRLEGATRIISANNLPTHPTGVFPIARSDDAYRYDRNPGRIREQDILLRLPAVPQKAASAACVPMGMIGFALTGAAIYNAVDARGRDAPVHEMQDACGGHPQQTGQYHYHDGSPCSADNRNQPGGHSDLLGYALDGCGIYGRHGEGGKLLHNGDLDACHGHEHELVWDGSARTLYHYHYTDEYPYAVGCFKGTPLATPAMAGRPPQGGGPRQPGRPQAGPPRAGSPQAGPPQGGPAGGRAVLQRAAATLGISERRLAEAVGPPPPDFRRAARVLGIPESRIIQAFRQARGN